MRRGKASGLGALAGLALACMVWHPAGADEAVPTQLAEGFIQSIGDRAVRILKACGEDKLQLDRDALEALIRSGFNIELIGRFVLGKYARKATPVQLGEYKSLYRDFFVGSFSRQLCIFRGDVVTVLGSQPVGKRDTMVETRVDREGQSLNASWRVRRSRGDYKIIDLVIDGVSIALSQRQEFSSILVNGGMDRLLEVLRNKLKANAEAGNQGPAAEESSTAGRLGSLIGPSERAVGTAPAGR
ncbi:MAG: ABC transporter substrate-binding protein [Kiloniellales bacterium]|nr:ABC transporter substrate-binding protein [Kiloniellales bacterium]